jgi:hypothetical protein
MDKKEGFWKKSFGSMLISIAISPIVLVGLLVFGILWGGIDHVFHRMWIETGLWGLSILAVIGTIIYRLFGFKVSIKFEEKGILFTIVWKY